MKHKTSELTGAFLDAAVALAEDRFDVMDNGGEPLCYARDNDPYYTSPGEHAYFKPSEDWSEGGPIIERERITLTTVRAPGAAWLAELYGGVHLIEAPTPLMAAMRVYVASKLGDEVELP